MLLISLAGIVGTWVAGRALTDACRALLDGIDRAAGADAPGDRPGEHRSGGGKRRGDSLVKTATIQLSQNVNDQGLVLTLLPPEPESDALTQGAEGGGVSPTSGELSLARSISIGRMDALPFVDLPKPDPASGGRSATSRPTMLRRVKDLNAPITEVRSNAAGAISRVTDGNAGKDGWQRRDNAEHPGCATARRAQARAAQLKQTIPVAITVAMIVLTLFMAWVAYTQIVVMRGAWRKLRAPAVSSDVALPSAEVSG